MKMTREDILLIFEITDILDLPNAVMRILMSPIENRNRVYRALSI